MRIRITKRGFYGVNGMVPVGTELEVDEEPSQLRGKYVVVSGDRTAVTNPNEGALRQEEDDDTAPKYEARSKGGGWWGIFDEDGNQIGKNIREDDAAAFNEMSDEDREVYVEDLTEE